MKRYYGIQEIADLYGLHGDTIRYYEEQGLIHPKRSESGYRRFSIKDIGALNAIRNLRTLGMSIARIRAYLQKRSVQTTRSMYAEEVQLIDQQIHILEKQRADVQRMAALIDVASGLPRMQPRLVTLPEMKGFAFRDKVIYESEVDFLLRRLEKEQESILTCLGATMIGAVLPLENVCRQVTNRSKAVFILTDHIGEVLIPAGVYASIVYGGGYQNNVAAFDLLFSFLTAQALKPLDDPREIYHVDMVETENEQEYVTEILLRVS